jgi:CheY-like chemotaxis protein
MVFRTGEGAKLAAATDHAVVASEVDAFDTFSHSGWSVLVLGTASLVTDPAAEAALARVPLRPWAGGRRWAYVRIPIAFISGRPIVPGSVPHEPGTVPSARHHRLGHGRHSPECTIRAEATVLGPHPTQHLNVTTRTPAMRIVVVDDDASTRALLGALLPLDGIEVVAQAGDGWTALEAVARTRPDGVILDLRMPDLDGWETLRVLHESFPSTRVVIYPAELTVEVERATALGATAVVGKGTSPNALADSLLA